MIQIDLHDSVSCVPDCQIIVTYYKEEDYGGKGWALCLMKNGSIRKYNLGHNSCCGPFDNGYEALWDNLDEFKKELNTIFGYSCPFEVIQQFLKTIHKDTVASFQRDDYMMTEAEANALSDTSYPNRPKIQAKLLPTRHK